MPSEGLSVITNAPIKTPGRRWLSPRNLLLLLLLAGLVYTLAELGGKYMIREDQAQHSQATVPRQATAEPSLNIQPILTARLFGQPESNTPAAKPHQAVEKTKLSLTLQGVIATAEADAIAIISVNQGEAQIYRPGQQVMPGVKLQEVGRAQVILERDGRLEQLDLFDGQVAGHEAGPGNPEGTVAQDEQVGQQDTATGQEIGQEVTSEGEEQNIPGLRPGPYLRHGTGSAAGGSGND
jgi:type II secretory pathway component PulC